MTRKYFCLLAIPLLLAGCTSPVPSTKFSGYVAGQPFEFVGHKQTSAKGVQLTMHSGTNTFSLTIAELSSQNDPQVISKSYAGQAAVTKEFFTGMNQFASKLVEGGVKGASPLP
jgi:hypothetical protein